MARQSSRAPSQRQLRVGEELRHALAWMLERGEVRDPGLHGRSITVTEVRISPDLKNATVFVVPLGGGDASEEVEALNRAAPFLRHRAAEKVQLRHVPKLGFRADDSFDNASHIDSLLHDPKVARDLADEPNDADIDPDAVDAVSETEID